MTNALLGSLAIAFLVHFALIVIYGQQIIQEPNPLILVAEIAGLVGILAFAIWNMVRMIRKFNEKTI